MKLRNILYVAVLGITGSIAMSSCDTDAEAVDIQKLTTYDAQYYENLRAFKQSPHEISYCYYAAWAPPEGSTGEKVTKSWGEKFMGLPDSLDICNLWMGLPDKETQPNAYADMVETREKKGTRFVFHADASNYNHKFWYRDEDLNVRQDSVVDLSRNQSEEAIRAYGRWVVDTVVNNDLDGVDFDCEGWSGSNVRIVVDEVNKYFGPEGKWPERLLIIDYFGGYPSGVNEEQLDFIVKQAYSGQGAGVGATGPDEKTVYCESFGQKHDGGQIEYYAKWEPGNGKRKGGCGAFYLDHNYSNTTQHKYFPDGREDNSTDDAPYSAFRRAIQIMNPAVRK